MGGKGLLGTKQKRAFRSGVLGAVCSISVAALMPGVAAAQEIAATGGAGIEGRVGDATGAAFFAGAVVEIVELGRRTTTGRDGRFSFRGVPAGTYTLEITYLGADTQRQVLTVSPGEPAQLDIAIGGDTMVMNNVLVVGQRAAFTDALNRKRTASNILSGVSSDFIGQFPDQNVTEAAQRIPGVSINRDQGEGRFISIRGASPNLNSVSINGVSVMNA